MPTASRTRTIPADQQRIWAVLADPHHLPRWWPGVTRVEGVAEDRFTEVFVTKKAKPVRVDFQVLESVPPWRILWEQLIPGTPFARVLEESLTEVVLEPSAAATVVTIAQRQKLKGYSRSGGLLLRRGSASRLDQALEGLAAICATDPAG
jgi:uncharacterized protein YndB with AHSA1/START domain